MQYIEEITEGADKQLKIQVGLAEIMEKWSAETFVFNEWKGRGINVLKGTGTIVEELEEAQVRPAVSMLCANCTRRVIIVSNDMSASLRLTFVHFGVLFSRCRFISIQQESMSTNPR